MIHLISRFIGKSWKVDDVGASAASIATALVSKKPVRNLKTTKTLLVVL